MDNSKKPQCQTHPQATINTHAGERHRDSLNRFVCVKSPAFLVPQRVLRAVFRHHFRTKFDALIRI